jgi:multidrug efflux pump
MGAWNEMRQPLGINLGGLLLSQALTLYTTLVIYLFLDRFGKWARQIWTRGYIGGR